MKVETDTVTYINALGFSVYIDKTCLGQGLKMEPTVTGRHNNALTNIQYT